MDALTASSVNSGNSFKHSRKVVMSSENRAICVGKSSGSKSPVTTGVLMFGGGFDRLRLVLKGRVFAWEDVS